MASSYRPLPIAFSVRRAGAWTTTAPGEADLIHLRRQPASFFPPPGAAPTTASGDFFAKENRAPPGDARLSRRLGAGSSEHPLGIIIDVAAIIGNDLIPGRRIIANLSTKRPRVQIPLPTVLPFSNDFIPDPA